MLLRRVEERARAHRTAMAVLSAASLIFGACTRSTNTSPFGENQEQQVDENGVLAGRLTATDAENDPVQFAILDPPRQGRVVLDHATGAFTYRPRRGFSGVDAFRFVANDGKTTSAPAAVVVSVLHVKHAPVAVNQSSVVPTNGILVGILWADYEENDPLTFAVTQPPGNGTLEFDPATRIFTYRPALNFSGVDSFQFTASDNQVTSSPGKVSVEVLGSAPAGPAIQAQQGRSTLAIGEAAAMGVVVASAAAPLNFIWRKNGLPIPGATSAAYTTPPVTLADTGTSFSVTAYDPYGSSMTSLSWTLTVVEIRPGQRIVSLFSNAAELLPRRNPLSVASIERLPSAIGAKVTFDSGSGGLPLFRAAGGAAVVSDPVGNALFIAFPDYGLPEVQSENVTLSPAGSASTFTLALSYTNDEWFAARGLPGHANVTFSEMNVPLASTRVEDWIIGQPTASDVTFAQATWGPVVQGLTTPTDKAQALARTLIDQLEGHRGIPSDTLSFSPPFVQYQMAVSGQGQVWCSNIAQIFALACQCFGIPARINALGRILSLGPSYNVLTNEGHAVTEIFDETTNGWVWIDPTLYLLGMEEAGHGLADALDVQRGLNDPAVFKSLFTLGYDPATRTMTVSDVARSPELADLRRLYGRESVVSIQRKGLDLPTEFRSNEYDVFPGHEDIAVRSLEALPSDYGVRLQLTSAIPDLDHFEYRQTYSSDAVFDETTHTSADGLVEMRFLNPHTTAPQAMQFAIKAVGLSGTSSSEPTLTIYLYSTEFYASQGVNTRGVLIFNGGDVRSAASLPEDWLVDIPTLVDLQFAEVEWGRALPARATPLEKARVLARILLDRLASRQGPPSAATSISPFDQYRRAISGMDLVDSAGLAGIFSHACNCLGIPARIVQMSKVLSRDASYDLLGAEDHSAVEIFDSGSNRWVWFDLSARMLGVELDGHGLLNSAELQRALNDSAQLSRLTAITYDAVEGLEARTAFSSSPFADQLRGYFQAHPSLRYARLGR